MHRAFIGDVKKVEDEANAFAGEFLMPKEAALKEITTPVTLATLIPLKTRWKVSIQTLIRRAYDLEIISQRQYKYLMQQMSMKGWRIKEPNNIPRERPRLISQMAESLFSTPINYKSLGSKMDLTAQMVQEIIEAQGVKSSVTHDRPTALLKFKKTEEEGLI